MLRSAGLVLETRIGPPCETEERTLAHVKELRLAEGQEVTAVVDEAEPVGEDPEVNRFDVTEDDTREGGLH